MKNKLTLLTIAAMPALSLLAANPVFTGNLDLSAKSWQLTASTNSGKWPLANTITGGLSFQFPQSTDDPTGIFVNMFYQQQKPRNISIIGAGVLQAVIRITETGTPVYGFHSEAGNTCPNSPATYKFYFTQGTGNDLERWWSVPINLILAATASPIIPPVGAYGVFPNNDGTVTVIVPLDPHYWISVYGEAGDSSPAALAKFQETLGNIQYIGGGFGGGCFETHGANVVQGTGTSAFEIKQYRVGN